MQNYLLFYNGLRGSDTLDGVKRCIKDKTGIQFSNIVDMVLTSVGMGKVYKSYVETFEKLVGTDVNEKDIASLLSRELVLAIYYGLIIPGKRENYDRGYLDFSHDSGSMFRLEMVDRNGCFGIMPFELVGSAAEGENGASPFVQCMKDQCSADIRALLSSLFPTEWNKETPVFVFTYNRFLWMYRAMVRRMQ